jgi:hypothetical protein
MISREECHGCRDDHYNLPGNSTEGRCWSAKTATLETRYRIYYLTAPTQQGAFTEVTVPSCYHQANGYVFYKRLPDFVRPEMLNRTKRKAELP